MIPADRVAASFRRFLVEEDPWEVSPSGFNSSLGWRWRLGPGHEHILDVEWTAQQYRLLRLCYAD
jgi:hypothetical protein